MHKKNKSDQFIISRYSDRLKKFGVSPRTLGWDSKKNQNLRFERLINNIDLTNLSILDVGCGFADFLSLILKKEIKIKNYTGIDINLNLIQKCQKKFPKYNFIVQNFKNFNSNTKFDIICLFGFINLKLKNIDNNRYGKNIIKQSFNLSKKFVAIDMLSNLYDHNYKKENFVNYYNPSDMIKYSSQLTSHFRLLHNYKSLPQREMLLILEKK